MRSHIRVPLILGVFALLLAAAPARAADPFPLKDGDTWVMLGDSITAQHMHSNYFEAFCYARYPKLTFRFQGRDFRLTDVHGTLVNKLLT